MCDSDFQKKYTTRISNQQCVRCGKASDSARRKCQICRKKESDWRKKTRERRRDSERTYKQGIYDKRIVMHSKLSDAKMERPVVEQTYITPERIRALRRLQKNKCLYCGNALQVLNRRRPDGLTVERIKNDLPHNSDNVILACHRCNCRRVGDKLNQDKTNLQVFHEIWTNYQKTKSRS